MKKNLVMLISIIPLLLCIISYYFLEKKPHNLGGEKINDFLYAYKIKESNELLAGLNIKNNDIYFLIEEQKEQESNYKLYKRNVYDNNNELLKSFTKKSTYCNLINDYIQCTDNKKIFLYNYDLENIYEISIEKSEDYPKIVPYKDTFVKIENNLLYIAQNKKEHVIRELPDELKNAFVENYYYTKDNTYLLFYNLNTTEYYVYDINNKKYEIVKSKNTNTYKNGFYFYDKDKYLIINKKDSTTIEYKNSYQNEYHYPSILNPDNKTLYMYDVSENEIHIIDLKNNTIIRLENNQDQIANFYLNAEYLYIECTNDTNNLYIMKTNDINKQPIKVSDELAKNAQSIKEKTSEIKNKYNVTINTKEETQIPFPDFTATEELNDNKILETIPKITTVLDKFSQEYFNSFHDEINEGLHIYLTSTLTPSDTDNQISNPAAYSLNFQNKYMIVLDINESNIEELLCHELMHNTELSLTRDTEQPFKDWSKYNPDIFKYNNSYTKPYVYNYTLNESQKDMVYFIDEYSHTYATEDRARIFESICSVNNSSIILSYPNLLAKGKYLEEEFYKYYPSLEKTTLFQSLK